MNVQKVCVYTCITGNYDNLKEVIREDGIDYLCFTNNRNLVSESWKIIYIESEGLDNVTLARKTKILMNDYIILNYDICIWIDGATKIVGNLYQFLETQCQLSRYDMTVFNHGVRNCVYDEAAAIIKYRKEVTNKVKDTIKFLREEKFPINNGLTETTVLIRKTKSEKVIQTMEIWFELLKKYSIRDQLTFDYSVYKTNLELNRLNLNVFDNPWFCWVKHNGKMSFETCRIFFGEYVSIDEDNFIDVLNQGKDDYIYTTMVKNDCKFIEIHCGQANDGVISNVNINFQPFISNCLLKIDNMYLLNTDPLLFRIDGDFKVGDKITINFHVNYLNNKDYKELLIMQDRKFEDIILGLNTEISKLNSEISSLNTVIQKLLNSTSWKLTKPIRELGQAIKKRHKEND